MKNHTIISFRCTIDEYKKLKELAEKESRSVSNYIKTKLLSNKNL